MTDAVFLSVSSISAQAQAALRSGLGWMSAEEQARLARITAGSRRASFLAGRWFARHVAAAVYGGGPMAWALSAPERGPPRLSGPAPAARLSLSHSGDFVACAVADAAVGVDIELPRRTRDVLSIARVICSPAELARLLAAEGAERDAIFYECWTLKEAWLKSRGEDISPGRLAQVQTLPAASAADAAGRSWAGAGIALALVAPPKWPVHWLEGALGECASRAISDSAASGA